jgi:hypothetical protein
VAMSWRCMATMAWSGELVTEGTKVTTRGTVVATMRLDALKDDVSLSNGAMQTPPTLCRMLSRSRKLREDKLFSPLCLPMMISSPYSLEYKHTQC